MAEEDDDDNGRFWPQFLTKTTVLWRQRAVVFVVIIVEPLSCVAELFTA
jgi:hypothetical protein